MDTRARKRLWILLSIGIAAIAPPAAQADVFAAVNVAAPPPRTDFDIAIVNASLGTRVALPAGVNTTAFEVHPSISTDGRRLVFRRFGGSDGQRVLVVDVTTGQMADLFTPSEIAGNPVFNSTISRDGRYVYTGRRFSQSGSSFFPVATRTDLSSFPTGPFPRFPYTGERSSVTGIVTDVSVEGHYVLMRLLTGSEPGNLGKLELFTPGFGAQLLSSPRMDYGYPRLVVGSSPSAPFATFEQRTYTPSSNTFGNSDVVGLPTGFIGSRGLFETDPPRPLYTTSADESQPAFLRKPGTISSYSAHVRHDADGHDRLFVLDGDTSTVLNPNGVDLGLVATRGIGAVSLYQKTVIATSRITLGGDVNATLLEPSRIGILVQRILGVTRERGEKHYELELVGRVPLGDYGAGNVFTHWDFAVDGEPLPPGRYLVTLRAVEGDLVRELGRSQVIRIPPAHGGKAGAARP